MSRPFCTVAIVLICELCRLTAHAQEAPKDSGGRRGEFGVAPIPVIDPTIGNGIALGVLYATRVNKEDEVSPPSLFAGGGLRTSNGTWAIAGGGKLYLKEDRYRILAAGG